MTSKPLGSESSTDGRSAKLIASAMRTLEIEASGITTLSAAIHDGLGLGGGSSCETGTEVVGDCIDVEGVGTRTTMLDDCRQTDPEGNVRVLSGMLTQIINDPAFCATGEVPEGADGETRFNAFEETVDRTDGVSVELRTNDLVVERRFPGEPGVDVLIANGRLEVMASNTSATAVMRPSSGISSLARPIG